MLKTTESSTTIGTLKAVLQLESLHGNIVVATCHIENWIYAASVDTAITSNGGNLAFPSSGFCVFGQPTDISLAPTLGPLQNNGGYSSTLALLSGSAGIDAAVTGFCPSVDQRNYPRLADGKCDIGAFEASP